MKKGYKYKSKESEENEKRHQFGQPGGNKPADIHEARGMREFYRWAENATEDQVVAFVNDKTKPYFKRKFLQTMSAANTPQDFFDLTNQTHGTPKQVIETVDAPTIIIDLGEDEDEDEEEKPKRGRKPKKK